MKSKKKRRKLARLLMTNAKGDRMPTGKRAQTQPAPMTEQDYLRVFIPHPLPYQGLYTADDSLEQPSQLTFVPTTTTPNVVG